jgi:WD40 repeat protein
MRKRCIGGLLLGVLVLLANQAAGRAEEVRSPSGKIIAGTDGDTIVLRDAATNNEISRLKGHTGKVTALAFAPDGKVLASGGDDKKIYLWDLAAAKQLRRLDAGDTIDALKFSKDGKTLTAREPGKVQQEWDVATGKLINP